MATSIKLICTARELAEFRQLLNICCVVAESRLVAVIHPGGWARG